VNCSVSGTRSAETERGAPPRRWDHAGGVAKSNNPKAPTLLSSGRRSCQAASPACFGRQVSPARSRPQDAAQSVLGTKCRSVNSRTWSTNWLRPWTFFDPARIHAITTASWSEFGPWRLGSISLLKRFPPRVALDRSRSSAEGFAGSGWIGPHAATGDQLDPGLNDALPARCGHHPAQAHLCPQKTIESCGTRSPQGGSQRHRLFGADAGCPQAWGHQLVLLAIGRVTGSVRLPVENCWPPTPNSVLQSGSRAARSTDRPGLGHGVERVSRRPMGCCRIGRLPPHRSRDAGLKRKPMREQMKNSQGYQICEISDGGISACSMAISFASPPNRLVPPLRWVAASFSLVPIESCLRCTQRLSNVPCLVSSEKLIDEGAGMASRVDQRIHRRTDARRAAARSDRWPL